ncbi:MAG: PAS domain S-box protein [Bacteroidota bacterium]|jgi:PAS domain S-box-containing protein
MKTKTDSVQDALEILIVEDSPTQAEQLRYILEQRRYKVLVADSGKKALALLADHKASLVITDIVMPEMNGYELCKQIKLDDGNRDIPVILLTSLSNSEDVLEGLACGADNFITKPYSEDFLLLHVEQILANRKLRKNERVRVGVEIMFGGKRRFVTADQQQMLGLLISTYEAAVLKNRELVQTQNELKLLNEQLEEKVEKRTAALTEEVALRKQAETRIKKQNRVYAVLSNVNQTIVRAHDTGQLFKDICRIAVEDGEFQSAWIGIVNSNTKRLDIVESMGMSEDYQPGNHIDMKDTTWHQTPAAIALQSGKHCVLNEVVNDALASNRRKDNLPFGCKSVASFPIKVFGGLSGVISLSSTQVAFFDEEEIKLLDEMAMDISFAIEFIQQEAERKRAEKSLKESEEKFRTLADQSPNMIFIYKNGRIVYANARCEEIMGYTKEEAYSPGFDPLTLFAPEYREKVAGNILERLAGRESLPYDCAIVTKEGKRVEAILSPKLITYENGKAILSSITDITERKRTEREISMLAFALKSINECVSITDTDNTILFVNQSFLETYGYRENELLGNNMSIVSSPKNSPEIIGDILSSTMRRGWHGEIWNRRKDGTEFPISLSTTIIRSEGAQPIGLIGIATDITERKRAEEALKESEAKFQAFFDNASDGMFVVDLKARKFFMCNATCAKMLGYAQEQFSNLDIADIHPGEDMPFIYEQIGKFSRGEEGTRSDIRFKRKDGSIFASDLSPGLVTIAENKYLLIIFKDITERKRSEEALRKSEEQYRTLFEESIDTVFTSTPTGEFTDINPAGVKLFGYGSKEEMLNLRAVGDLFWKPGDRERYLAAMATQGFVKDHELECKTKDGKKIIVLETAIAVRGNSGKIVAHRGILRDITVQKRLEKEFLRAQRMESIGTLAGGVAHDINNVLAPIMMAVEILQTKFPDEESTRILHTLATSAKRGSDIVKQILAFGRGVEGERIVIQPKHVIREIQDIATETFPKSIHIKPNIPNNLWTILSDPTQIHQVLLNICVNARDAMPKGGTLTISSENVMLDEFFAASNREAKPGPYVVVTITDTGTGIPPGILERIFDPFFTTKEIGKGTGLGLSTALGIVKSHGGFIDVHGAPGQGTSFKVYLPAQMKEQEAVTEKELPELPLGNGELILVVDDEASISEIAKLTLEANGYQAVTANDGVEAVTICARDKGTIRLVLMDMNMPVMDGPATIRALRMMKINAKIVATSGASGGDETMMESIPGVHAFLKKPYTAEKLLTTLHDVLNEG